MIDFRKFITEGAEGKNVHLEHIEDEVLNGGVVGTRSAIRFLESLQHMLSGHATKSVTITTKWDGAPAIFAGVNPENGKFFVGTKGIFAKNAKLNYTNADIDANHSSEGLNVKLKLALKYLPELGIEGIIQGDMMFSSSDLKHETIDGEKYVVFQPNTIAYAVPVGSALARQIESAKIGVVWHTSYHGKTMSDMQAHFGVEIQKLRPTKNVWFRDADFIDASGTATFTQSETDNLTKRLGTIEHMFRSISPGVLNQIASNDTYKVMIKTFNNRRVRAGQKVTNNREHVVHLLRFVEDEYNKRVLEAQRADTKQKRLHEKKIVTDFFRNHQADFKVMFDLITAITEAKLMIIGKLKQVKGIGTFLKTADGYKITSEEGFVAVDRLNNKAIKLVDRLEFSHANFNVAKNWTN